MPGHNADAWQGSAMICTVGWGFLNEHDVGLVLDLGPVAWALGDGTAGSGLRLVGPRMSTSTPAGWCCCYLLGYLSYYGSHLFVCVCGIRHCLTAHLGSPGQRLYYAMLFPPLVRAWQSVHLHISHSSSQACAHMSLRSSPSCPSIGVTTPRLRQISTPSHLTIVSHHISRSNS